MSSTSAGEMKCLVAKIAGFSKEVWKQKVPQIAFTGIEQRFRQNPNLKEYLCKTGSKTIVEAALRDRIWGIGISMHEKDILKQKSTWGENL